MEETADFEVEVEVETLAASSIEGCGESELIERTDEVI